MYKLLGKYLSILVANWVTGKVESENRWLICSKQQISHGQCFEFSISGDKLTVFRSGIDGFVVNWQDNFFAYQNSCPHTGASLNWMPNQFFDFDSHFLQCGIHGALFEPHSGFCVHGPCVSQSLLQLPLIAHKHNLYLDLDKLALSSPELPLK